MTTDTRVSAVIVAAGRGTRAGGDLPKQWRMIAGRPIVAHTLDRFTHHPLVDDITLVIHPDDAHRAAAFADQVRIVVGAATRDGSVRAGLQGLDHGGSVLIHDVARPCVDGDVITRVLQALRHAPAAAPALAVTDALWRGLDHRVDGTVDRKGLFRAQTPQGFHLPAIQDAHARHPGGAADDVEVARAAGLPVTIVEGSETNLKVTHPGDFDRAAKLLEDTMDIRMGNGFDVHAFCPGDHVTLCGVPIPHNARLTGHSDADVGMHAVTDALYGALADGDIGRHFPPSDPQWKGAASEIFLDHAVALVATRGYQISNVDCTLICEQPKIGPHAAAMIAQMARILRIGEDRVSIKATTSERLGFTGREEGIAALASAVLVRA